MTMLANNGEMTQLIIAIGIILVAAYLIGVFIELPHVIKRSRYLTMEINRTDGSEKKHWQKEKKQLWLSLLPFVRYK